MITITPNIQLNENEVEYQAVSAQGPGGQHVNKTATAIQLRFDIANSSLPREVKQRLLGMHDHRVTKDGVVIIKAQDERSQLRNKQDALQRLILMIRSASHVPIKRIPTRPGKAAKAKRMDTKTKRGLVKQYRQKPEV